MNKEDTTLMMEILRNLQKGQKDLLEGQADIKARLNSLEHKTAGSIVDDVRQNMEIDAMKTRLQRIEKRLEIDDSPAS